VSGGDLARPQHRQEDAVTHPAPDPEYLGPAAHTSYGHNKPIGRIVIHATVSPCIPGGAAAIAAYFRSPRAGGSAHYVVDPADVVQVVFDDTIAWHAPPNQHSLGIEMCDFPSSTALDHWETDPENAQHGTRKSPLRWLEKNHRQMLRRTAHLTAQLCLAYGVPVKFLSAEQLRAGEHGITTHANVTKAFAESTHWDPGVWPKRAFMREVRRQVAKLTAEGALS
jgi:hypothetical protein